MKSDREVAREYLILFGMWCVSAVGLSAVAFVGCAVSRHPPAVPVVEHSEVSFWWPFHALAWLVGVIFKAMYPFLFD